MQSCGEAIVRYLEKKCVRTVFGIPGVHNLELYRGLQASSIRHVLCRNEQGAGFLADGYSRASGQVGVAFVITGPGLTNIATAIGQAFADSIPMLVISSVNESWSLGRGTGRLHECDRQLSITDPITAFNASAQCVEEIPALLDRAFEIFSSERPRPVHIEVPLDLLAMPVEGDWQPKSADRVKQRPSASEDEIRQAVSLINKAKRPIVIAGGGAIEATTELRCLVEKIDAPMFTSVAGKGVLPIDHVLNAGATLCTETGWSAVESADLVVAIGTEMADTDFWRDLLPIKGALVRVDIDRRKLDDLYPATLAIESDATAFVSALIDHCDLSTRSNQGCDWVNTIKAEVRANLPAWDQPLVKILDILMSAVSGARIVSDMTQMAYAANYTQEVYPVRHWLHPTGFGTLGYAMPAAIGAGIADPETPVVAIVGDGGLQYTLSEWATSNELQSPVVLVIWNNARLGQIWDDMERSDIKPIAVAMTNPDFELIAKAYDTPYRCPKNLSELTSTLTESLKHKGFSVIEVTPMILENDL